MGSLVSRENLPDNYAPNFFFTSTVCGTGETGMNGNTQHVNLNCSQHAINQETGKLSLKNLFTVSTHY